MVPILCNFRIERLEIDISLYNEEANKKSSENDILLMARYNKRES